MSSDAPSVSLPVFSRTRDESSAYEKAVPPQTFETTTTHEGYGDGTWPPDSPERKLHEWLEQLDGGRGVLLQYFEVLRREFCADLSRIAEMRLATPRSAGILGTIDAYFWELCEIKQMGHRLLLAKGINALQ
jgi:hypothetical protein